jgi:hypothetical protein
LIKQENAPADQGWWTLKRIIQKDCRADLNWTNLSEFIWKRDNHWYDSTIGERICSIIKGIK